MNDHEALLVAALRSGDYKQGGYSLRPTEYTFCCLGVACDLYRKETGVGEWAVDLAFAVPDGTKRFGLPPAVQKWIGWQSDRFQDHLSRMNDAGRSFNEIATAIETGSIG